MDRCYPCMLHAGAMQAIAPIIALIVTTARHRLHQRPMHPPPVYDSFLQRQWQWQQHGYYPLWWPEAVDLYPDCTEPRMVTPIFEAGGLGHRTSHVWWSLYSPGGATRAFVLLEALPLLLLGRNEPLTTPPAHAPYPVM